MFMKNVMVMKNKSMCLKLNWRHKLESYNISQLLPLLDSVFIVNDTYEINLR